MRTSARDVLGNLPGFRSIEQRRRAVRVVREAKSLRRRGFERLGSSRYSRLGIPAVEAVLSQHLDFDRGLFVEAGANDGLRQSNTYYLERCRGWRGLLIEPIPELFARCRTNRPKATVVNCALVGLDETSDEIEMRYADLGSTRLSESELPLRASVNFGWDAAYEVRVQARTLSSVLEGHGIGHFDFLSLDVEGFELQALAGLYLDRNSPRFLLLEVWTEDRLSEIRRILGSGYELVERVTDHDAFFRRL